MYTNPVTGEVTFDFGGNEYVLKASAKRLAEFQAAIVAPGFPSLLGMIASRDARAIYHGLRCLCKSGNPGQFDDLNLIPHYDAICDAIISALTAGLPEKTADDTNPHQATATIN